MVGSRNYIILIAQGDSKAFESLLYEFGDAVLGLCHRYMGSKAEAEDMAQETWTRVIRSAGDYNERAPQKAWLLTIARNVCLNELRKRKWSESLDPVAEQTIAESDPGIEEVLIEQSDLMRVKVCMDLLPDSQRVAVVLSISEELSHSEVSVQLGIQVNAVKQLLFRARQGLMKCLGEKR